MENDIMQEFIGCLQIHPLKAYDFIAKYGDNFSKKELLNLIKEMIYTIQNVLDVSQRNEFYDTIADELIDL